MSQKTTEADIERATQALAEELGHQPDKEELNYYLWSKGYEQC